MNNSIQNQSTSLLIHPLANRGLIPFLMAGYPDWKTSLRLALTLVDEGAVALEIGVPFSDPVADGPVIQMAAGRALEQGTTLQSCLQLVEQIKIARPKIAIVLFTYLNPILRLGLPPFAKQARQVGVDATLVVDLPPEEAAAHVQIHRDAGLGTIFLASPTSSAKRLKKIVEMSTGFVYGVSRTGITGEASLVSSSLKSEIETLRKISGPLPIGVGFGISTPQQAGEVARLADAVIIGSRFISLTQESTNADEAEIKLRTFARDCVRAIQDAQQPAR